MSEPKEEINLATSTMRPATKLKVARGFIGEGLDPFTGKAPITPDTQIQLVAALEEATSHHSGNDERIWESFAEKIPGILHRNETQHSHWESKAANFLDTLQSERAQEYERYPAHTRIIEFLQKYVRHNDGQISSKKLLQVWNAISPTQHDAVSIHPTITKLRYGRYSAGGILFDIQSHPEEFFKQIEMLNSETISDIDRAKFLEHVDYAIETKSRASQRT